MNYLFTSESVSEGHPDKVADQISDAVVDEFLARDPDSRVACETLVTTGQVVLAGEIRSSACIDVMNTARHVISRIGYNKAEYKFDSESCGIFSAIHGQSADISRGVVHEEQKEQGAGDQGMMFGYATNETPTFMPLPLYLANLLLTELADIRREGRVMTYLRPDAKSQVTVEYNERNVAQRVHTIVVSTQHDEFITGTGALSQQEADIIMQDTIREDVRNILIPRVVARLPEKLQKLFDDDFVLFVNPTGKFVIGGPHGDTGLTGRKIIVDTYGGRGAHGGGAFSGKDPSKVDRSAAYAARHIAKNLVAAGVADEVLVQVAYAIGVAKPVSLCVNTCGSAKVGMTDAEIGCIVADLFDMTPFAIEKRFDLRSPIYEETAAYGHFGREPKWVKKKFTTPGGEPFSVVVRLFPWEELDYVGKVKEAFGLE